MKNFTFYNPTKIVFGKGTIGTIGKEIKSRGLRRVLLLAGGGSIRKNGVYDAAVSSLREHEIEFTELWGVRANPALAHAREAVALARDFGADSILAIGGGSAIDEAKAIAAGFYLDDVWDAFERKANVTRALPIFTILTISATASEMNCGGVLSNDDELKKWAYSSPLLYPVVSVIDPSVQATLPPGQTAFGGVDAMAHLMENYFAGTDQEVTLAMSESLMRTIVVCMNTLVKDPSDYNARANFAWAATLALNGITGTGLGGGDWSSHMIEHGLSAVRPEVAHGAGLAIIFPAWIKYVAELKPAIFERWALNVWNAGGVAEGIERMTAAFKSWGAPVTLAEIGVGRDEIPAIARSAASVGSIGLIRSLTARDIENILNLAY